MRFRARSLAAAALALAAPAHATIVACSAPPSSPYVVYLSEPQATPQAFGSRDEMLRFMEKLQFTLDQGRDGQWVQLPNAQVRFASCKRRTPALDGGDFADKALVETMYNGSVLLEVWGSLDAERHGGTRANASAQMNYLLVPLRYAGDQGEAALPGLLRLAYPEAGAKATADFVELLVRGSDIDALVAAALGYKALRERSYDLAHDNLCRSGVLLERVVERASSARQKADAQGLRAFVLDAAAHAVRGAKAGRFVGSVTLYDAAAPCAQATGARP